MYFYVLEKKKAVVLTKRGQRNSSWAFFYIAYMLYFRLFSTYKVVYMCNFVFGTRLPYSVPNTKIFSELCVYLVTLLSWIKMCGKHVQSMLNNYIFILVRTIKSAYEWLYNVMSICNKKVGTPYQRCTKNFENVLDECKVSNCIFCWRFIILFTIKFCGFFKLLYRPYTT